MFVIGILLIAIGLTKLYQLITFNDLDIKELVSSFPNIFPEAIKVLIALDGISCTIGGIMLCLV